MTYPNGPVSQFPHRMYLIVRGVAPLAPEAPAEGDPGPAAAPALPL